MSDSPPSLTSTLTRLQQCSTWDIGHETCCVHSGAGLYNIELGSVRCGRHDRHAVRLVACGSLAMMVSRCLFIKGLVVGYFPTDWP
jgi:hypothetical protein